MEILHRGLLLAYSTNRGIISSATLHSGCRNRRHSLPTRVAHSSAHAISSSLCMTTFNSSARSKASFRGFDFCFGDRQTQSNSPENGCEPEVSKNMARPRSLSWRVKGSNGYIRGSPPVMTIDCAAHATARSTISVIGVGGYIRGFQVYFASHHAHPTSQPPRRIK